MMEKIIISVIICFTSLSLSSQSSLKDKAIQNINKELKILKSDKQFKNANWSYCLLNCKTDKIVSQYNSNKSLTPASTMKVVTSATALSLLGENYQFKTKLQYSGHIDVNGVLHGNLYIKGGGDPTFGSSRFGEERNLESLMLQVLLSLKKHKIKKINGAIIGDASVFENAIVVPSWSWEDIGNYYGAGISGLSINENMYKIIFKPGRKLNEKAEVIGTDPYIPGLEFVNNVTTAKIGSGDNAYIFGSPYSNLRYLEGTVPLGKNKFVIKGAIPDPPYFCACILNSYLKKNNISISVNPSSLRLEILKKKIDSNKRITIQTYKSPYLSQIVKKTNIKSINTYAEALLKIIAFEKLNKKATTKDGIKIIKNFWKAKGVNIEGFEIFDGSGLSRKNFISTYHFTKMLRLFTMEKCFPAFKESLSIAGKTGYLKNMFKGTNAVGKLFAKSGTIQNVKCYTGYVKNNSNEILSFAVMVNNYSSSSYQMKKKMEKLMVLFTETY